MVIRLVSRPAVPLPHWLLYSLPDGCWVYAYTSWMMLIWGRPVLWVWSGVILAVGAELGQLLGPVPETYDNLDMAFYVGAFILAMVTASGGKYHADGCRFLAKSKIPCSLVD